MQIYLAEEKILQIFLYFPWFTPYMSNAPNDLTVEENGAYSVHFWQSRDMEYWLCLTVQVMALRVILDLTWYRSYTWHDKVTHVLSNDKSTRFLVSVFPATLPIRFHLLAAYIAKCHCFICYSSYHLHVIVNSRRYIWCVVCAGSSLEVKIETDSNDAVLIKTEADSNDITEYPCDDLPSIGMFRLLHIYIPWIHSLMIHLIIAKGLAFYHCPSFFLLHI